MSSLIPKEISSPAELTSLLLEIKSYANWFGQYINAQRVGAKLSASQPELSSSASAVIRALSAATPLTATRLDELIVSLEHTSRHAPVATITLAAPATSEVKRALTDWCRRELSPDILITYRFNAGLLGGMMIRVGSHLYDWSFRTKLMENRRGFTEVLNRV